MDRIEECRCEAADLEEQDRLRSGSEGRPDQELEGRLV